MTHVNARWTSLLLAILVAASALAATGQAGTTVVNISNVAPTVASATLPASSFTPTSGSTTSISTTAIVSDLNGCNDISSVTVEILKPDGSRHAAPASATYSSCAAGTSATYAYTFTMAFHDDPALLASTYKVRVVATDREGATGSNAADLVAFNYAQLAALSLGSSTLDFTEVAPGSQSSAVGLAVQNYGNLQLDVQLSGTALAHASAAANIPVSNLTYSTASDMSGAAALATSTATLSSFDLAKGASSSKTLYWRLSVPSGGGQWVPSGSYSGTATVTAVAG